MQSSALKPSSTLREDTPAEKGRGVVHSQNSSKGGVRGCRRSFNGCLSNGVCYGVGQDAPGGETEEEAPLARVGGTWGRVVHPDALYPPALLYDLIITKDHHVCDRHDGKVGMTVVSFSSRLTRLLSRGKEQAQTWRMISHLVVVILLPEEVVS